MCDRHAPLTTTVNYVPKEIRSSEDDFLRRLLQQSVGFRASA